MDVGSALASNISKTFHDIYSSMYGQADFFSVDTFNEMPPPDGSQEYLEGYARNVSSWLEEHSGSK